MLRIRLTRVGRKKQPRYRIVVADSKRAVQAKFLSILGWYNPQTKEVSINKEEAESWLQKGANPTNSVSKIFKKEKIKLPKWVEIKKKVRKPKKDEAEETKEEKKIEQKPKEETKETKTDTKKEENTKDAGEEKPEKSETKKEKTDTKEEVKKENKQ